MNSYTILIAAYVVACPLLAWLGMWVGDWIAAHLPASFTDEGEV